ncbi:glycosyltransferase [Roseibium aggregatum]|uniref:Glycosyltransferase n=1 Tax=Roseibium aggregatum TaxID=187304 RepID=A0A926P4R6_9HYPH|nr:glycosyltransferase [Roseibium aggregatum]MBD1547571.1 glycosyltransferase [Roseibium aggregatum]
MISVIIPTLNSEIVLAHTLAALVPAAAEGVVREVIVVDGGSSDNTHVIADAAGCDWCTEKGPRSKLLEAGAKRAQRGDWLLFLSADTVLEPGWFHEVQAFVERAERSGSADRTAAAFKLKFEAFGMGARLSEVLASLRSQLLGMPYGNQGLIISRRFYARLGGYRPLPEMEDLDLVKRIGRRRLVCLRAAAISSGRLDEPGFLSSMRRSIARFCVGTLRVPPKLVLRIHG